MNEKETITYSKGNIKLSFKKYYIIVCRIINFFIFFKTNQAKLEQKIIS